MKKLLVIAVALASANAFATRARVNALGNAPHLVDTQTVYSNPSDMNLLGDYVTLESGKTTGTTENDYAEGMVVRSYGNSKLGLGLGHQSKNASVWGLRDATLTGIATIKNQQNPINLSYATKIDDLGFGATLVYSNYNNKGANEKESSAGVRFGIRTGAWDAKLGIGLINKFENATDVFKGTDGYSAGVGYAADFGYLFGSAEIAGFKTEDTAGAEKRKLAYNKFVVGYANSTKKEGNEFFYALGLGQDSRKLNIATGSLETKTTALFMPFTVGMEVDAASWLTLRGSLTQNVIIHNSKTEATTPLPSSETAPGLNTTTAAVGAGLKYNNLSVDGTLQGLTGSTASQKVDGTDLLAQVGMTYKF